VQALPSAPGQPPPIAGPERAAREELLRLAGVLSVRLQEPGRPMVTLAPVGQIHAPALLDMRSESAWARLWATLSALTRSGDRLLLVVAPSPKRPQAVLSVVLREGELDDHLKEAAATVALHGLSVAIPTGILVHVTLLVLLVRPMRRLTQSIAAFRADPERTPPLEEPRAAQETRDEMVLAQRELAAMQRELRAALWRNARLAALGAALARVSHDLRGILTVERASELVRNTLEFAGEVPAAPRERVALRDLVQEVAEEVRTRHPLLRVDVRVDAGLAAHGDRASLRRALANLIRNAAEAGARRVAVSAAAEGDLAVVTLEDDGPGLPEVVRSSLFQPFVTSGKKGGTGLGLAITRDLVRAQGGEIGLVRSTAEGSVFRLALHAGVRGGGAAQRGGLSFYQGMGTALWSRKPPLSAGVRPAMTASRSVAACAGGRTSSPVRAKGAESLVSTVPGCRATQMACGARRRSSMAAVRTSWFSAALLAR
jgi:signal transduction histidine kinase